MRCLNKVQLIGALVEPVKVRSLTSGKAVCNFEIETIEHFGGQERRERHTVSAFGPVAEALMHVEAGRQIYVEGSLRSREFTDSARPRKVYETVAFLVIVMQPQARVGEEQAA